MEGVQQQQQFVNKNYHDYEDGLAPGYRFCPTDAELIVCYLKAKIEKDVYPPCRIHEVNIYNYNPDDLANEYRSCDNKWYFLTPRERQCPKGSRPNRKVGNFGKWKAAQKDAAVLDVKGQEVGRKRSLNFMDENGIKTSWLMQEYTTTHPNLPIGTGPQTMLSNWVLCKIYKLKEEKNGTTGNVNQAKQQQFVGKRKNNDQENQGSVRDEQNQQLHNILKDEPSPKRTRLASDVDYNQQQQSTDPTSQQYYYNHESMLTTTADGYHCQQNQKQMSSIFMNASTNYNTSASTSSTTPNDDHQQTPSSMIVTSTPNDDHESMLTADGYHHYQQNQVKQMSSSITASTYNATASTSTTTPNDDHQQTTPSSMIVTTTTTTTPPSSCPPLPVDMFLDDDDFDWVAAIDSCDVLDDIYIPADDHLFQPDDEFGRYLLEELVF
uniref:NAC domain-containing protein 2-like n=1 Tax=Erigeron canadensis TaxID=72917 RepID=UPI001CB8973B|nr:NAC domain-containing protein 2-like [Erigeron canadensis]